MTLTYLHTSQGATVAAASALTGRQGQEGSGLSVCTWLVCTIMFLCDYMFAKAVALVYKPQEHCFFPPFLMK